MQATPLWKNANTRNEITVCSLCRDNYCSVGQILLITCTHTWTHMDSCRVEVSKAWNQKAIILTHPIRQIISQI